MKDSHAEFFFRIWLDVQEADHKEVEVWYQGLEDTGPTSRPLTHWAYESFSELVDYWYEFDIDPEKPWQIVGKIHIHAYYDSFTYEYDEDIDVVEFEKVELPSDWFDDHSEMQIIGD